MRESNGKLAEVPFSTWGKGSSLFGQFSTPFSHQCLIVSCSSCEHLFWIDLFHLNHERIQPRLLVLPGMLSKCRQIWGAFCCSVLHWTEIALDNLPVILWESATEKREFQVSNNPLNASLVVQHLSTETVSWSGSFQLGDVNCHSPGKKAAQLNLGSKVQHLPSSAAWFPAEFNQGAANCHQVSPAAARSKGGTRRV